MSSAMSNNVIKSTSVTESSQNTRPAPEYTAFFDIIGDLTLERKRQREQPVPAK